MQQWAATSKKVMQTLNAIELREVAGGFGPSGIDGSSAVTGAVSGAIGGALSGSRLGLYGAIGGAIFGAALGAAGGGFRDGWIIRGLRLK